MTNMTKKAKSKKRPTYEDSFRAFRIADISPVPLPPIPPIAFGVYHEFVGAALRLLQHGALEDPLYRRVAMVMGLIAEKANRALCGHAAACNPVVTTTINPQTGKRR